MTVLALIAMGYFAQVKARDDGDTVNAEPSLIIVPASIVRQTFREIDSKFGDFFNVHVFHGGKSSTSEDAKIADATIGAQELEDLCLKWLEEKSSPEVSELISISTQARGGVVHADMIADHIRIDVKTHSAHQL